jgi:hypothetical protein
MSAFLQKDKEVYCILNSLQNTDYICTCTEEGNCPSECRETYHELSHLIASIDSKLNKYQKKVDKNVTKYWE